MDVTWVNGKRVGAYEDPGHHYTVRKYPVPAGLLKTGKNTIAVRVMDHGAPGGIAGKPDQLALQLGKERISLANLWHFAPGANLEALNEQATLVGPKPGWNAEVTAWRTPSMRASFGSTVGCTGAWQCEVAPQRHRHSPPVRWVHSDLRTPFGGMKDSGTGREGGKYSLEFYSETKNVCIYLGRE